jgi:hypothetical protein
MTVNQIWNSVVPVIGTPSGSVAGGSLCYLFIIALDNGVGTYDVEISPDQVIYAPLTQVSLVPGYLQRFKLEGAPFVRLNCVSGSQTGVSAWIAS